jgi:phenylpropionate dioxygenase-like ring-hydroxylating dioxygenase large terminal subunit
LFIHQNQLRHLLAPAHYKDERHHQIEIERLFLPAWHVVATTAELRRPGDFLTTEVLGRPLLLRNCDGEVCAYLNSCAHRSCMLTSKPRGHDPRFRCQYHGWEYDRQGHTGKIPDARCFRPFDRENACLHCYRTETCGELVFVCLDDQGPSLSDFLGPYHAAARDGFAAPFRFIWSYDATYHCNWKVPIENSLESYHIPCLHAKTFGDFPPEEQCEHDLQQNWTTFRTAEPDQLATRIQRWFVRRLGRNPKGIYTQHHTHPHIGFASLDVFHLVQIFLPTSPTTCRHLVWVYSLHGSGRWNPWRALLARLLRLAVKTIARQIVLEDRAIYADVQRGLEASVHPGVIGTREERVFVFQDYVLRNCAD